VTSQKCIVLGVTGSIAAYKSADIIRQLRKKGFRVLVVMTKDAERFITPLTLASLAGEDVYRDSFDSQGSFSSMAHIELAKKAAAVLIAPATANIIGKMACGIADSLLTGVVLATKAPIVIAPAMNTTMYQNTIVQENCLRLKKHGMHFIDPIEGGLACGEVGEGHIAEIEDIVSGISKVVQ